jgi:hypothetical protein
MFRLVRNTEPCGCSCHCCSLLRTFGFDCARVKENNIRRRLSTIFTVSRPEHANCLEAIGISNAIDGGSAGFFAGVRVDCADGLQFSLDYTLIEKDYTFYKACLSGYKTEPHIKLKQHYSLEGLCSYLKELASDYKADSPVTTEAPFRLSALCIIKMAVELAEREIALRSKS